MMSANKSSNPEDKNLTSRTHQNSAKRLLKPVGLVIGTALLVGAIAFVAGKEDVLNNALNAIVNPSWPNLLLLIFCVFANIALTGLMFSVLISRYGKVGLLQMQALIAAATLLNFLPLRPGLFGRLAYHKTNNNIPVRHTALTIIQAIGISLGIGIYLMLSLLLCTKTDLPLWVGLGGPLPFFIVASFTSRLRIWALAGLIRYVEVFVWAARYYAAFALIDYSIHIEEALAFACISMIATLVPFFSNGLGIREWAIGLAAPLLTAYQLEHGLTAELVNRTGEIAVVLIAGFIGIICLMRLQKKKTNSQLDP